MEDKHIFKISAELKISPKQAAAAVELLDGDATVPFIARYRKEATGSLDEVTITVIRDRIVQLRELDKRRDAIKKSLEERQLLSDELNKKLDAAGSMVELEDIYLPYKPKRRTRAMIARERGLEPLAELLFAQENIDPQAEAEKFIDPEKEVNNIEDALAGARDIIAEWINEDADARSRLRTLFNEKGILKSKVISGKETEGEKYADYFEYEEEISKIPSHRILAVRRGEREGILSFSILPPEEDSLSILYRAFLLASNRASEHVKDAINDGYKRLLAPSLETEIRNESRKRADTEAIRIFAANLRELLMAPPLGGKNILALDPGFRTGCKLVCLDRQGKLLHYDTIYPHNGDRQRKDAADEVKALYGKFKTEVIAVGNGTAGRETLSFLKEIALPDSVRIEMVNESGASVYSASEVAREEFSQYDVTVRGAVSIGRRLMDPLAELVKIDPKSIGVGQYQHDVSQSELKQGLDDVVVSCVNAVGVEVNTASKQLLSYVSGLGPQLAENIVKHRDENGPFDGRKTLTKVARLGPKAFEQAAGFLRISSAKNPLDRSAVHPESYYIVEKIAKDLNCSVEDLISDENLRKSIKIEKYVDDKIGLPTLRDIMDELAKPGRDPRQGFEHFSYDESVNTIDDLRVGMTLPGIVTNVAAFGAFVDIGVHQDGLVHISELADRYVKDPNDFVKVHQKVQVTVIGVEPERKRIALSIRKNPVPRNS